MRAESMLQVLQPPHLSAHGRTGATQCSMSPSRYNRGRSAAGLDLSALVYGRSPTAVRFPRGTIGTSAGLLVEEIVDETLFRGCRPGIPKAGRILGL